MDDQVAALAELIDPEVWAAAEADQTTIGSQWDMRNRRRLSQERARHIISSGYAVVKLPDMVVDQDGFTTWQVSQLHDTGAVRVRKTDQKIDYTSVFSPFRTTQEARAFAAALLAAAAYVDENRA
ncbi:hypothetical protein IU436_27510 [Nocardia farcinica]|uniref:hypothetical protein n=1 Tax=Nocardia TaxID=1817 RepID=UPI001895620F|nr:MULTISPECIES: hypothetical protein [Nocardia]MBF6215640.1 hypothetical protein [Nocardia puris]MBF6422389.1 hypothetical protein [Nocardia farcinica]MBF6434090.1 hypothetical protein [Nocardia farcinica]MBF6505146.1 hypothetical protein [Nocardia farcinica]